MLQELIQRYISLKNIWLKNRENYWAAMEALLEIKESGLFKQECPTWSEWCLRHTGRTADSIRVCLNRLEDHKERQLIAETTREAVAPKPQKRKPKEPMTAKLCKEIPIEYVKPPPPPLDVRVLLQTLCKHLDRLLHRQDMPYEVYQEVRACTHEAQQALNLLQGVLPGFEEVASKPKLKIPTQEQVIAYCKTISVCNSDAEWFHDKMLSSGWKNDGKPVNDWMATIRMWRRTGGIFPSQRQVNAFGKTVPKERTLMQKENDRILKDIERL